MVEGGKELPKKKCHKKNETSKANRAFRNTPWPGSGKPAEQIGVDNAEPNDAKNDRHWLAHYERKRFDFRPDGDELLALIGWIEEYPATLPTEPYEAECKKHCQVHGDSARNTRDDGSNV